MRKPNNYVEDLNLYAYYREAYSYGDINMAKTLQSLSLNPVTFNVYSNGSYQRYDAHGKIGIPYKRY